MVESHPNQTSASANKPISLYNVREIHSLAIKVDCVESATLDVWFLGQIQPTK